MHGLSRREPTAKDAILTRRGFKVCKISQRGFGGAVSNRLHIIVNQGTTSHNIDVCLRETTPRHVYVCRALEAACMSHNVTVGRKRESRTMSKEVEAVYSP